MNEKIIAFNIKSKYGCFKKPTSNDSKNTYNIITKSALIGIIGSVCGIDRNLMKKNNLYKLFSDNIEYTVQLNSPIKKTFWSEYSHNHLNWNQKDKKKPLYSPSTSERITDVNYNIYMKYDVNVDVINKYLNTFISHIKDNMTVFPIYMGMANFKADIEYIGEYDFFEKKSGLFETFGFVSELSDDIDDDQIKDILYENIPTKSLDYLAHDNTSNISIFFNSLGKKIIGLGNYYKIYNLNFEFI